MAFKMRSGNGPLAFKNMGSSPAKGITDRIIMEPQEAKLLEVKTKEPQLEKAVKPPTEEKGEEVVSTKGKTWQEKEGEFRDLKSKNKGKKKTLREIQKDERKHLKTLKEEPDHKDLKKELRVEQKAERKMMRKKYRKENKAAKDEWKSDPAYKKHKKEVNQEEMRRTVAGLREYGPGGSGSQTEGKAKYDAGKIAQSNREKTQASQDIRDARTKQLTEQAKIATNEETTLNSDTQNAIGADGVNFNSNTTEYVSSSDRAVQIQKDRDKQIANDKAKMEKELGINQD